MASTLCCLCAFLSLLVLGRAQVPCSYCTHFAKCFGARNVQLSRLGSSCVRCFSVTVLPFSTSPNSGAKIWGGVLRSEDTIFPSIFAGCASFSWFFYFSQLLCFISSHELATCEGAEINFFERGHNNPPEVCPSVVECSIPQFMGVIGKMLVGSLTALNSSVVLPVKNSRGGAPSRWRSLKVVGHVDGPLLSPICLFAISGMSAIVLHAHFQKLAPGDWPKLPEQDTPALSASQSCRATQGTSIESLTDRILTVSEILPPDECCKIVRSRRL